MAAVEEQALRAPRTREKVAARVSREMSRLKEPTLPEGVQPLNTGFFLLEALRANNIAKVRAKTQPKIKGK